MIADVSGNNENVTKRGPWIAALACAALLATTATAANAPGKQLPPSVATYLLGAKLIRGEIVIKRAVGERDYRLDQQQLVTHSRRRSGRREDAVDRSCGRDRGGAPSDVRTEPVEGSAE